MENKPDLEYLKCEICKFYKGNLNCQLNIKVPLLGMKANQMRNCTAFKFKNVYKESEY